MTERMREWLRSESLGIAIPVGFVLLWAVWGLAQTFAGSFLYPVVEEVFGSDDIDRFGLQFELFGIEFLAGTFVIEIMAVLLLALAVWVLFVRDTGVIYEDETRDTRPCPECFSEIIFQARRCPFCTAVVEPLAADHPGSEA